MQSGIERLVLAVTLIVGGLSLVVVAVTVVGGSALVGAFGGAFLAAGAVGVNVEPDEGEARR